MKKEMHGSKSKIMDVCVDILARGFAAAIVSSLIPIFLYFKGCRIPTVLEWFWLLFLPFFIIGLLVAWVASIERKNQEKQKQEQLRK